MRQSIIIPSGSTRTPAIKLCRDCVHFKNLRCYKYVKVDLVYGTTFHPSCDIVRYDTGYCGPGGKDFELKPPPTKPIVNPVLRDYIEFTSTFEEQDFLGF